MISGFVITSSLLARGREGASEFFRNFYARRFKRILPALVLFVLIAGAAIASFSPGGPSIRTGMAALFGLANMYLQFYFLYPLLVWLAGVPRLHASARSCAFPDASPPLGDGDGMSGLPGDGPMSVLAHHPYPGDWCWSSRSHGGRAFSATTHKCAVHSPHHSADIVVFDRGPPRFQCLCRIHPASSCIYWPDFLFPLPVALGSSLSQSFDSG